MGKNLKEKKNLEKLDQLIKKESKKPKGTKFCPECGSKKLYFFLGLQAGRNYVCKECGYRGALIIENGKISDKIREKKIKELKKNKKNSENS